MLPQIYLGRQLHEGSVSEQKKPWAGVIYVLTNLVNGKQYVGKTTRASYEHRWQEHVKAAERGKSAVPLQCAIRKYRPNSFAVSRLQRCKTLVTLDAAERKWIRKLHSKAPQGYNLTDGGDGFVGSRHKPSSKRKTSLSMKNYYKDPTAREKTSTAGLRYYAQPGSRELLSAAHSTLAAIKNMSAGQRKRFKRSEERAHQSRMKKDWFANEKNHKRWLKVHKAVSQDETRRANCVAGAKVRYAGMTARQRKNYWKRTHPNGNQRAKK